MVKTGEHYHELQRELEKVEKCRILGMNVTVLGFLILITIYFYDFISSYAR